VALATENGVIVYSLQTHCAVYEYRVGAIKCVQLPTLDVGRNGSARNGRRSVKVLGNSNAILDVRGQKDAVRLEARCLARIGFWLAGRGRVVLTKA
jgi:hypothetical protein